METHLAEFFPHVRIVMGMVIGLGITRILMGVAGLIQHPNRALVSPLHLLWAASIMLELIFFWWWEFELYAFTDWSFGTFFFLIFYSITLFLLAALLFPDKIEDYDGYEDFFLKRRKWFFGVFALTFVLDVIDTLIKGAPYLDSVLDVSYLIQVPIGIALSLVAMATADRRYHLALVLMHLGYQAYWITQLFTIHI